MKASRVAIRMKWTPNKLLFMQWGVNNERKLHEFGHVYWTREEAIRLRNLLDKHLKI